MSGALYFDDIQVGDRFESQPCTMSMDEILDFASKYDPQPFHLDEETARESIFGGLVASGWHTAAVTMRLLISSNPFAGGLIGSAVEIRWERPTRPGDDISVFTEVIERRPHRSRTDRGVIVIRAETRNGDGEVLQSLISRFLIERRSFDLASSARSSGSAL
ncbi:MAG: MaoC family dehydratase [Thiohalobacteraceae bacterium]